MDQEIIEGRDFREVLGHYPTGVVVVAASVPDGSPVGMTVGSFSSVSLTPALVAFYPDKRSSTWPLIQSSGSFCINVLGAEQENVCRAFASSGGDKFRDISWRPAVSGAPVIDGVLAWVDCDIHAIHDAGDHQIVLGRVRALGVENRTLPLLFFRGGYGKFLPLSLAASGADLSLHLSVVDAARPDMELLASELGVECVAAAVSDDELVYLASAGRPQDDSQPTWVGLRVPFVPPIASVLVAWADHVAIDLWLSRTSPQNTDEMRAMLEQIRRRGFSVGLKDRTHDSLTTSVALHSRQPTDPVLRAAAHQEVDELGSRFELLEPVPGVRYDVGRISAPVFGAEGRVVLALNLHGLGDGADLARIMECAAALLAASRRISERIGGRHPDASVPAGSRD